MSENPVYNIIEVANTHGGDEQYVIDLITEFKELTENFGMKFQPLKPDAIAIPDYEFYSVYEEFFFDEEQWALFIRLASATKEVWLDLFDTYGVEILKNTIDNIHGLKLQASVLNNYEVLFALEEIDISEKRLIVNVAGHELTQLKSLIANIEDQLKPGELLIEIGFQAYPTQLSDSGFSKIRKIKDNFSHRIVFADHLDANSAHSKYFPVFAAMNGADVIEKHVRLDQKTVYDHFSSLTPDDYRDYIRILNEFIGINDQPFINERETDYLKRSLMKPLLNKDLPKGSIPNPYRDFTFKRSGRNGLDVFEIEEKLKGHNLLVKPCSQGNVLQGTNFKKAHIAVIIACRLKSTRLKSKALEKIGDLTSIEYCIRNCLKFPYASSVVLATSIEEEDAPLENYTYNDSVHFHRGDPDDVIRRYADIINLLKIDIFVRVTGDNPFVDADICKILIDSHFRNGADYTTARHTAIGANLEIINTSAVKKVMEYFPSTDYSEYMGWYFTNNPEYFSINYVDLPEEYVRDYRLTLDYPQDLKLYNLIDQKLSDKDPDFGLLEIYDLLDQSELSNINQNIGQKDQTDNTLIETLREKTKISPL